MQKIFRFTSLFIFSIYCFSLQIPLVRAQSANATFVLSPASRSVAVGSTFEVQIKLRASGTKKVSYARAIIAFDPSELEITQPIEHSDLFCNFPTDSANFYANNVEGSIMITGISTGTQSCPYPELTTSDSSFATIVFRAKKASTADVAFIYNGQQNDNFSGILDVNSPTQFIMTAPQDGRYTLGSSSTPTPTPNPTVPDTGIDPITGVVAVAIFSFIAAVVVSRKSRQRVITA